jgi:hypothetical protein
LIESAAIDIPGGHAQFSGSVVQDTLFGPA